MSIAARIITVGPLFPSGGSSQLTIASMNPHSLWVTEDTPDIGDVSTWDSRTNGHQLITVFPGRELMSFPEYLGTHGKMVGTNDNLLKFLRVLGKDQYKFLHNGTPFTVLTVAEGKTDGTYSNGIISTLYNSAGTNGILLSHSFRLTLKNNGQQVMINEYNSHIGVQVVAFGLTATKQLWMHVGDTQYNADASGLTFIDNDHDYGLAIGRTEGNSLFKVGNTAVFDRELTATELTTAKLELKNKHNTP